MKSNYRDFLNLVNYPLAIFECGAISGMNQQFLELFSCSKQDIFGQTLTDLSPEFQEDGCTSAETASIVTQKIEDHDRYTFQWQFKKQDGALFTADVCFARAGDSSKQAVLATIKAIPEYEHTEILHHSDKDWTETILQSIQSGVFIIDSKTHEIIDINRAAEEMTGATRSEIIGKICHTFVCPKEEGNCPIRYPHPPSYLFDMLVNSSPER